MGDGSDEVALMIRFTLVLGLVFVWAFTRARLAAFAQKTMRAVDIEYQRRQAPAVLPPAAAPAKDAAEAAS